ncbi:hypothetical protein BGZ61DRAFT_463610 [Ilyonectria robusta]|uniref:uncharacterized protein n=1 Tax=Ilyonectria robusta TaxID=1079257 RepID=UPI001E8CE250|nr:uncharacterized protein BGZ61DRAFT_463610 [Ilyonectria robusta]KAH8661765.1 hypothetical protein BGZ61DRAFT_463610 [Ilyonectria robusta]
MGISMQQLGHELQEDNQLTSSSPSQSSFPLSSSPFLPRKPLTRTMTIIVITITARARPSLHYFLADERAQVGEAHAGPFVCVCVCMCACSRRKKETKAVTEGAAEWVGVSNTSAQVMSRSRDQSPDSKSQRAACPDSGLNRHNPQDISPDKMVV